VQSKVVRLFAVLLLLLAVAGGAYYGWHRDDEDNAADRLTVYGNVDIREAQLAFNGSEHLAEIRVQEGDRVKAGQLLARLHTELLDAELNQARAELSAQRQEVAKLEAGSRPQEIDRARAQLKASQARAKAAEGTYRRLQKVFQQKLASPEDVEDARAKAEAARGDRDAARQTLELLVEGPRQEDLAAARAQLQAREAALVLAQQRLADASLFAPADGVIRDRILEPGDFATPQTPVLTLALLDPVWVRAYLPESALGKVAPGMKAEIHTDSYPGKSYPGWVGYISPTAEFTPKSVETPDLRTRLVYQVRVFACNPQDELRLGMPATVVIPLDQPRQAGGETDRCKG
jgi:HlyD family secretion protein